jgi:hypothetical protein
MLYFATLMSDRNAAKCLNRIRLEKKGIIVTTLRNTVERTGALIGRILSCKAKESLLENGFSEDAAPTEKSSFSAEEPQYIPEIDIISAAESLNIRHFEHLKYELPEHTVNISVDDVCVKRQTKTRPRDEDTEQPKRVDNTVIHVENNDGQYILNAESITGSLKLLIGFLLRNNIFGQQLVFFTDGARNLHAAIEKMFSFANYKIILDWYHLEKKCKEQLSMGLCGSAIRNKFLAELMPCLWFGNVDGAILLLQNLDSKKIKNYEIIKNLIDYFERVRGFIPCYALRKQLGLRNSSNAGEKSNDRVVSKRQKHNGMSWSNDGSFSFASVSAAFCNGEIEEVLFNRNANFTLIKLAA